LTNKEAIKQIEIASAEVEWNYPLDYSVAFDIAIKSINKQIEKEVIIKNPTHAFPDYICPTCNKVIPKKIKYCIECGQLIDWRENE